MTMLLGLVLILGLGFTVPQRKITDSEVLEAKNRMSEALWEYRTERMLHNGVTRQSHGRQYGVNVPGWATRYGKQYHFLP